MLSSNIVIMSATTCFGEPKSKLSILIGNASAP